MIVNSPAPTLERQYASAKKMYDSFSFSHDNILKKIDEEESSEKLQQLKDDLKNTNAILDSIENGMKRTENEISLKNQVVSGELCRKMIGVVLFIAYDKFGSKAVGRYILLSRHILGARHSEQTRAAIRRGIAPSS